MSDFTQVNARVETEIKDALDALRESDGIKIEHQIRMGCLLWLESKGVDPFAKKAKAK